MSEPILRAAEMIVALEQERLELRRYSRRCIIAGVFLSVAGLITAAAGVLLPRPESLLYLVGGFFDGCLLWAVLGSYREYRRMLQRIERLRN